METFNYQSYLDNYPDLSPLMSEQDTWRHYQLHGKAEGRTDIPGATINTTDKKCKFGAILFYNIICTYIAKCNNLKMKYSESVKTRSLGIDLYTGEKEYDSNLILTNENIDSILLNETSFYSKNIHIHGTLQTTIAAKFIREYLLKIKPKINVSNVYRSRISANNDLFVHVRLDGIKNSNDFDPFEYYNFAISKIKYDTGYISSDAISHPICTKLIRKYNLSVINGDEVKTIQFGSTCKWLVLSKCTFSWFIGVLGFQSTIYYPERLGKIGKHVNIFAFKDWNKVNY